MRSAAGILGASHDGNDLDQLRALLVDLETALAEERASVARLDADALTRAFQDKQRIAGEIQLLGEEAYPGKEQPGEAPVCHEVRTLAMRVRASALANGALLSDALRAVADVLGCGDEVSTYDRRAQRITPSGGHRIRSL